ncbi:hypothetical protein DL96DRAFT_882543 [Flagelloscypha sp. PMI_526]|nr:hypothetical protein DL96DRAFT_882543 [Flagelloscypha sp. PMI_526]
MYTPAGGRSDIYIFVVKCVFSLLIYLITVMVSLLFSGQLVNVIISIGHYGFGLAILIQSIALLGTLSNYLVSNDAAIGLDITRHLSSPYIPSLLLFLYLVWMKKEDGDGRTGSFFGTIALIRMMCPYQTLTFYVVWLSLGQHPSMFIGVCSIVLAVTALVCLFVLGRMRNIESEELPEQSTEVVTV